MLLGKMLHYCIAANVESIRTSRLVHIRQEEQQNALAG